jgi:hypothetical protein
MEELPMAVKRFGAASFLLALAMIVGPVSVRTAPLECGVDPLCAWNELALKTARVAVLNDARSARLLALVNVAMYDAVNGIESRHGNQNDREAALVAETDIPAKGDPAAAAAAAAYAVLAGEFSAFAAAFPDGAAGYNARLQVDLAGAGPESDGARWGASVGARVLELRAGDTVTVSQPLLPAPPPGQFQPAWNGQVVAPFALLNPEEYVGAGPAALDSLSYAGAFAEIKVVGDAAKADADMLATFRFWSLGNGTSQPPGAWVQMALLITRDAEMTIADRTRMLALLTMSLSDTVGPTTVTKARYRHWRPTAAIAGGDLDPNPYTDGQAGWLQRGTPATSPEYWSGHSAFGGAGAAALAGFFCSDNIAIAGFQSDSAAAAGIAPRDYPSFSAAGAEMGSSRVVGGLHFSFSNRDGIAAGRAIAAEVLATKLLRKSGPTHFGACPR